LRSIFADDDIAVERVKPIPIDGALAAQANARKNRIE
jgi:hypothetical protein